MGRRFPPFLFTGEPTGEGEAMRKVAACTSTLLFITILGASPARADTTVVTLRASGGATAFGKGVATTGDKAVIGAPTTGAAYYFERTSAGWTQRATLRPSDIAATDEYGSTVAMSTDTVLVGAPSDTERGIGYVGSVRVFGWSGSAWTER